MGCDIPTAGFVITPPLTLSGCIPSLALAMLAFVFGSSAGSAPQSAADSTSDVRHILALRPS